jgi:hypothetical protein
MLSLYGERDLFVGSIVDDAIVLADGNRLQIREDELFDQVQGHVGYFFDGVVYNVTRQPQASTQKGWNK